MSNEHNIDKLLKESFESFSPEAPDVWQAVQQGVQAAQVTNAAASSGSAATVAVKGVALTLKVVAGIVLGAAAITGYVFYTSSEKEAVQQSRPVEVIDTFKPLLEENSLEKEKQPAKTDKEKEPAQHFYNHTGKRSQSEPKEEKPKQMDETVSNITQPGSHLKESLNKAGTPEAQWVEAGIVKESITSEIEKDGRQQSSKPSVEPPYNPYAEDGEVDEKPVIPGSFSPNNDGLNDKFEVIIENESYYSMRILNEKGELVFESKSKEQVWDGRHYKTGTPCAVGKYLYVLSYQFKGSDKVHEKSGIIALFF